MSLPKFIITRDGYLRLGMVKQHKDLLQPDDDCIGDGFIDRQYLNKLIQLPIAQLGARKRNEIVHSATAQNKDSIIMQS